MREKETISLPPPTSTLLFAAFVLLGAFASIKGGGSLKGKVEGWVDVCWTPFYSFHRFVLFPLLRSSWRCCHQLDKKHELSFCSVLLLKINVFHDTELIIDSILSPLIRLRSTLTLVL